MTKISPRLARLQYAVQGALHNNGSSTRITERDQFSPTVNVLWESSREIGDDQDEQIQFVNLASHCTDIEKQED